MSEKFVVGQWVTRKGVNWKVVEVSTEGDTVILGGYGAAYVHDCFPVEWKGGKTYRTTLAGVTATVADEIDSYRIRARCDWHHPTDSIHAVVFNDKTGTLRGFENRTDVHHLLPYLADEPPPESDAATFSEFADADECNPQPAVPSSMENKIAGIYCCDVVQYFNFNIGSAIASLWTCDVGTNANDAMLSLKAAAWFVQREIERRAKR